VFRVSHPRRVVNEDSRSAPVPGAAMSARAMAFRPPLIILLASTAQAQFDRQPQTIDLEYN